MIGIVVTGHGHFPSGLLSAIELVAGKPENVAAVDFEGGQSQADLQTALDAAIGDLREMRCWCWRIWWEAHPLTRPP